MTTKTVQSELWQELLDIVEVAHYKCDLDNDEDCYAEQYGDGDASHHELIRKAQADVHLIAAAPDLLAALEQTVTALEHWFPRYGDPQATNSPMMKQARAAIAKATVA